MSLLLLLEAAEVLLPFPAFFRACEYTLPLVSDDVDDAEMCLVFMTRDEAATCSVSERSLRSASLPPPPPAPWPLLTPLVDEALEADRAAPLLRLRWRLVLRFVSAVVAEAEPAATGAEAAAAAGLVEEEDDVLELLLLRVWGGPDSITSPICQKEEKH